MKCISVYTNDFEQFSNIYEKIMQTPLQEDEEREIDGVTVYAAGQVPDQYVERMRQKRDFVVMRVKDAGITILQRGEQFEIILPEQQNMVH
ncbi:NAD/NADP transhydrogenase alpha subunit [Paenibacillus alvei]|uniref:NAD/NADP transhydrogenase alpha subunit n=1 Tax=Paenibacillus alvei TaxID=44250 RepID=A0ABT4GSI5_PAEAL|nr:NAD/NADP transhydrogenase alpha subunit [Paenibacillus alvei]MCY9759668.1 NAD/NADP transhydrogenase alpha subunit [Paenibacillus alvei]MCY9767879.1 NAD/NADP transhydrogenase alpha subunit [Paenibacillus alvei]